jgi:hypothetical protein
VFTSTLCRVAYTTISTVAPPTASKHMAPFRLVRSVSNAKPTTIAAPTATRYRCLGLTYVTASGQTR